MKIIEKSKQTIDKQERILVSNKDASIFFNALVEVPEPNDALQVAAKVYQPHKKTEK